MSNNTLQSITCELEKTIENLKEYEKILFYEEFYRLKQRQLSLTDNLKQTDKEGRLLRIGIVGSVKAGKSTFLNALLFEGQTVLPKAATPMTASLTRLHYAKKQFVRFVFYSQKDWNEITQIAMAGKERIQKLVKKEQEKNAQIKHSHHIPTRSQEEMEDSAKRSLPPEQRACVELVENADINKLDLHKLFGQTEEFPLDEKEELCEYLKKYISGDGEYTAIVRHVELGLNHPILKDLEIIDTPGLNDPVVSRSMETYKSLSHCDAVLILSRASQFLTASDMTFIKNTLREEGISRKIIIASQFDGGMASEKGKLKTFVEAFRRTMANVHKMHKEQIGNGSPICTSAMLESCAYKQDKNFILDAEESLVLKNLQFFDGAPTSSEDLRKVANMAGVRAELKTCREDKDSILHNRKLELAQSAKEIILTSLRILETNLRINEKDLKQINIDNLQQRRKGITNALNSVENYTKELFIKTNADVKLNLENLSHRIINNIRSYSEITVHEGVSSEERSSTSGMLFWKKTHYRTVETTKYNVDLQEVLGKLRDYATKSQKDVINVYAHLISVENISEEIKKKMLPFIRDVDQDYDENIILIPLCSALHDLKLKPFTFNNEIYNNRLVEIFPREIEGNESIHKLKVEAELTFQRLGQDLVKVISEEMNNISRLLMDKSNNFIEAMRKQLSDQMDKLEEQLKEREVSLQRYSRAIEFVNKQIAKLSIIGE